MKKRNTTNDDAPSSSSKKKIKSSNDALKVSTLASNKVSIDELFKRGAEKKKEREATQKQDEEKQAREDQLEAEKKREVMLEQRTTTGSKFSDPKVHRMDQETGLPVYKYFDLGMALTGSGFTKDCPFDCDCCH